MSETPPGLNIPEDLQNILSELVPDGYTVIDSKVDEDGALRSLEVKPNEVGNITYLYAREGNYVKDEGISYPTIMCIYDDGYAARVRVYVDGKWVIPTDSES
jgi:hypothetical protein